MNTDNETSNTKNDYWISLPLALTAIILIHYFVFMFMNDSLYSPIYNEDANTSDVLNAKGLLGDFSSGHFTFLAFVWMTYAVFIQRSEFKLQREEFEGQTEEFKLQRLQFEEQNLHTRYSRMHNLLNELYYNTEYLSIQAGHQITKKGLRSLIDDLALDPLSGLHLEKIQVLIKFIRNHNFVEEELNNLLNKYSEKEKQDIIKNIQKEFKLQWRDTYSMSIRIYIRTALVHLRDKSMLEGYFLLSFIDPIVQNKSNLTTRLFIANQLDQNELAKIIASINDDNLDDFIDMEQIDFIADLQPYSY